MRHGPELAKPAAMRDGQKTVRLVKQYDRPEFRTKPTRDDTAARLKQDLKILRMELAELKDQRRRLHEEVNDTIKMLIAALEDGKEETETEIRRRISRLKGSLEYPGRHDFVMRER